MTSNPLTVLLPAHAEGRLLKKSVRSIQNQTFISWQMLLLLDSPTRKTESIAQSMANADSRISILRFDYRNLGRVLFEATETLCSEFVARMDGDDIAHPTRFEHQVAHMLNDSDVVALGSNVRLIDKHGLVFGQSDVPLNHESIMDGLLRGHGSAIVHPTAIFRREALMECGSYSPRLRKGEDLDLFLRLSDFGRLSNLSETLLDFRKHAQSSTHGENRREALVRRHETVQRFLDEKPRKLAVPPITPLPASQPKDLELRVLSSAFQGGHGLTLVVYLTKAVFDFGFLVVVIRYLRSRLNRLSKKIGSAQDSHG